MKLRITLLVLLIAVFCGDSWAQKKVPNEPKHHDITDDVLYKKIKQADELFDQHSYYNAIDIYEQVWKEIPENKYVSYRLGEAHYITRDHKSAVKYYKYVDDPKTTLYPLAIFHYGQSLMQVQRYEDAKIAFRDFQRIKTKDVEMKRYQEWAKNEYRACDFAMNMIKKDTAFYRIDSLQGDVNHGYSEFSPLPLGADTLVFASRRQDSIINYEYSKEQFYPVRLFQSVRSQDNIWSTSEEFWDLNESEEHTANATYSVDEDMMLFTKCVTNPHNSVICHLYVKEKNDKGEWSKEKKLHHKINSHPYTSTQPTFGVIEKRSRRKVTKQNVMYFVSNRPGGFGGMDIWFSRINDKGHFSKPINCGKKLNSVGNEVTPFYDHKTGQMYFSSDYHYGLGGYDIVVSKGKETKWGRPVNVGIPFNSSFDDTYYRPFEVKGDTMERGYIVSNRPGGHALKSETCCDDIYGFQEYEPEIMTLTGKVVELILKEIPRKLSTEDSSLVVKELQKPLVGKLSAQDSSMIVDSLPKVAKLSSGDSSTIGKMTMQDQETIIEGAKIGVVRTSLLRAATKDSVVDFYELESDIEWIATSDLKGGFSSTLIKERDYVLVVDKDGYEKQYLPLKMVDNETVTVVLKNIKKDTIQKKETPKKQETIASIMESAEEIKEDQVFVLEDMYFDTNMDQIKKASLPSLQLLLDFLEKHPQVKIEIAGHTDSRGNDEYNMDLSQRRAESVVEYLEDNEVSPKRLKAKGYGETKPIAPNENVDGSDNPEGRRLNRRTEVVILSNK